MFSCSLDEVFTPSKNIFYIYYNAINIASINDMHNIALVW